jgi:hypothetical protein
VKTLVEHIQTLSDDRIAVHRGVCRVIADVHPGVVKPFDVGAYTGNGRVAFGCLVQCPAVPALHKSQSLASCGAV